MHLDQPPRFALHATQGNHLTLRAPQGPVAHVFVLEHDIVRLLVLPEGSLKFPRTWSVAPGLEDLPVEGRDRFDLSDFAQPAFELEQTADDLRISTRDIRLSIRLNGLHCRWETRQDGQWRFAAADRETQSYN
ncbi:MAG: DUF4968 domain-containing protein, partial [Pseudomonadota bacterium]|nr:DUF4968 domain-containing protein [Pseudomonadota bacterium]